MTKGITISQEGIDVSRALDSQKVLDSRWRYFEIAIEKTLSLGTVSSTAITNVFEHKLGFVPAFDCYNITQDKYIQGDSSGGLRASRDKIYFDGFTSSGTNHSNSRIMLRIYNVPILEEYFAPIDNTLPVKTASPSKYGVRITTKSNGMKNQELSTYALNTSGKSLAIQRTGTTISNSGTSGKAIVRHDIGNPPTFMASQCDPQLQWVNALDPSFVPFKTLADGSTITFSGAQAAFIGTLSYIIFKELADFAI